MCHYETSSFIYFRSFLFCIWHIWFISLFKYILLVYMHFIGSEKELNESNLNKWSHSFPLPYKKWVWRGTKKAFDHSLTTGLVPQLWWMCSRIKKGELLLVLPLTLWGKVEFSYEKNQFFLTLLDNTEDSYKRGTGQKFSDIFQSAFLWFPVAKSKFHPWY